MDKTRYDELVTTTKTLYADFQQAQEATRAARDRMRTVRVDFLRMLDQANIELAGDRQRGGRTPKGTLSWSGFCRDIGIGRRTAQNWLEWYRAGMPEGGLREIREKRAQKQEPQFPPSPAVRRSEPVDRAAIQERATVRTVLTCPCCGREIQIEMLSNGTVREARAEEAVA